MKSVQWKKIFCLLHFRDPTPKLLMHYQCKKSFKKRKKKKSLESRPEICDSSLEIEIGQRDNNFASRFEFTCKQPLLMKSRWVQIKSSSEMILLFNNKCRMIFVFVFIFSLGFTFFIIKINNKSFDLMKVLSAVL